MTPGAAEAAVRRAEARARGEPLIQLAGEAPAPYSIARAVLHGDGFEAEVSAELQRSLQSMRDFRSHGGVFVPPAAILETSTATGGAELLFTSGVGVRPALRPLPVAARLGVRIIPGMRDSIRTVRITTGHAVAWINGETLAVPATPEDMVFDSEEPSPATGIVTTGFSRRLDVQSSPAVAQLVDDDFRAAVAAAIDAGFVNGSGATGQPYGLIPRAVAGDITSVAIGATGGAITRAKLVEMEHALGLQDGDRGPLAWLTSPQLRAELRTIDSATNAGRFLWENGRVLDYPAFSSRHVPATLAKGGSGNVLTAIILGHWPDAIVVVHAIEVVIDPFSLAAQGLIKATAYTTASVALHEPDSFIAIVDATHATF